MGTLDYIIIGIVAVWFAAALRSIFKRRGGCTCGCGNPGHSACGGNCAHRKREQSTCSGCSQCGKEK